MDASLSHGTFAQQIKTSFRVQAETAGVELELIGVSELKLHPGHEQFSIVFRGPIATFLGQGTRSFEHDQIGQFELFIVPIRSDNDGYYYEAVFNRFRE
jgi:Domain of unknown function (DUF6916)